MKPLCGIQLGAKQATGREYARKGQHPRDQDQRREDPHREEGEWGKEKKSRKKMGPEHGGGKNGKEGIAPPRLQGRERPNRDERGEEDQSSHVGKGQPSLRCAWRQAREDKTFFFW